VRILTSIGFAASTTVLALLGASPESRPSPLFVPVPGPPASDTGRARGVAWGDLNEDGFPELYVSRSTGFPNTLYNNHNGTLVPLAGSPASVDAGDSEGATFIDFDNDGDLDLHVVARNGGRGLLLENDGTGGLVNERSVIAPDSMSASVACWADVDRDGDLDVFLVGYRSGRNQLFRNEGTAFVPVPLPRWAIGNGDGRSCAWGDPNDDGFPDLAVAVALRPNILLLNRGHFRFDRGELPGHKGDSAYSYGVSWADVNEDGRQDLFVANFTGDNVLYLNEGNERWETSAEGMALDTPASKGHAWADYDLDGDLDLYLGSGTPEPGQRNILYLREGSRWLADSALFADTSAGIAWGDVDRDGDADLFVANWGSPGSPARMYHNTTADKSSLTIRLRGTRSNSHGIGAKLSILAGGRWQHRWMDTNTGYAGSNQAIIQFGMGKPVADSLVVHWPSGSIDAYSVVQGGHRYLATEGRGLAPD
jgi:hypothetical protein